MFKKFIIANWKMNPQTQKEAESLFLGLNKLIKKLKNIEITICPPFVFLNNFKKIAINKKIKKINFGAQNVFYEKDGAYTGEISLNMLKDFGVKYVIVGHSERRELGEGNDLILKKVNSIIKSNMTPVLCVGEKSRDISMDYLSFIKEQIISSFSNIPKNYFSKVIVAYEPIWAIGKKAVREATPEETKEMIIFIRKVLADMSDFQTAHNVKILYGGSVNSKNIENFMTNGGVDGVLVGGASLSLKEFSEIILKINNLK